MLLTAALLAQFLTDHATAAVPAHLATTLPGAAWRQANLAGPVAATGPVTSLIRRFFIPASAALLILAGGVWAVAESGWFSGGKPAFAAGSSSSLPSSGKPVAEDPALLFRCTAANLPAKFLAVRLLTYESGPASDAALLAEVRSLAKTGGTVEDFDISTPVGRTGNFKKTRDYEYSPDWSWDEEKGVAVPDSVETRFLGTALDITATEPEDGGLEITWRFQTQPAEPEFHAWPLSLEKSGGDPERSIQMADFHETGAEGRTGGMIENEPRLLLIQHLPSSTLPDAAPGPRTLLLFVTLNPS
ncbi:MAG: hypothetical protein V4726_16640 [Verrucomicrobiota bacterium]